MKKTDIIKLRLKGVSTDEIKQLMELETMAEDAEDIQEQAEDQTKEQTEDQTEEQTEDQTEDPAIAEMRKQLEETTAQLKENEEKLKAAQKANINRDISGQTDQKSDQDILNDIVRSFM